MKSGDEFVAKVKEFKEHDKNVDGLLVEVYVHLYSSLYSLMFICILCLIYFRTVRPESVL